MLDDRQAAIRPLIVPGIESRLSQVFLNVIANAVSFSPPRGEIRMTARHDGRAVLVTVEDEGPGIPEDKLTAIFDRFYTERPPARNSARIPGSGCRSRSRSSRRIAA